MTGLTLFEESHITLGVTMFIVNVISYFSLGAILKAMFPKQFKVLSHVNGATGKEIYKLTFMGTIVILFLQPLILWGVLSMKIVPGFA